MKLHTINRAHVLEVTALSLARLFSFSYQLTRQLLSSGSGVRPTEFTAAAVSPSRRSFAWRRRALSWRMSRGRLRVAASSSFGVYSSPHRKQRREREQNRTEHSVLFHPLSTRALLSRRWQALLCASLAPCSVPASHVEASTTAFPRAIRCSASTELRRLSYRLTANADP